jgi:hypothetical protein
MDFIEQWFHVSPDGGNGALEGLYLAVIIGAATLSRLYVVRRRRRDDPARGNTASRAGTIGEHENP